MPEQDTETPSSETPSSEQHDTETPSSEQHDTGTPSSEQDDVETWSDEQDKVYAERVGELFAEGHEEFEIEEIAAREAEQAGSGEQ